MFEMTCAANATGCTPMQRGMTAPEADLDTVSEIFALKGDGGITEFPGAVDFVQGSAIAGGVFVTVRVDDERIREDLHIGEHLYDFGGFTFHGIIERADITRELGTLPVGLAPNAKINRSIKAGEIITWDDVLFDENLIVVKLRREQDRL